jgi:Carboxypeptidase regulatory-like domain
MQRALKAAFLLVLVSSLLSPQFAFGDNVYASIRGLVTDPAGAAVANATVTATNTDTGIVTRTTSSADGNYVFPQLAIGTYKVTAAGPGFKGFGTSSFVLTVNQVYNLPIRFDLGSASETVEVRADTTQVETTNIQLETLVDEKNIIDMPLINRNWTALEQLTPGVVAASDRFGSYSANGSQSNQSSYLVNGVDSNDLPLNVAIIIPSVDALQEFNIITNTINPEYGRNSGAVVNAVLKSGTNQFHGDAFEFYRDTFLNTSNWLTHTPPAFHQNTFGGTIGGPIWKDHTFAFFSFQGIKNRQPQAGAPSQSVVFSNPQRGGAFADLATSTGTSPIPLTGDSGAVFPAGTPYSTIFSAGTIPTTDFDPVASSLLNKYIPGPNSGANEFTFNPTQTGTGNYQEIARIDHTFNASDSIWGTMFLQTNPSSAPIPLPGTTSLPGFGIVTEQHFKQFIVDWNHSFNSTTLNEFRVGYTRYNLVADQPANVIAPSSVGFNINSQITSGQSLPFINILGSYGFAIGFTTNGPQPRKDQTRELTDNFSKVIGKHTIKAGFDFRRFDVWNPFSGNNNGAFSYNGKGAFSTGDAGADFLLGIPDSFSQGSGGLIIGRAYEYYSYIQDQWKVRSNLTLTLGTGWQIDKPLANQQFGGEDVTCFRPGQQSTVFPNAPQDMLYPGDKGCDSTGGLKVPYTHFGPRIGFAWSPDAGRLSGGTGKLSIRAGWGFYYNRAEEEGILQNLSTPPFSITSHGVQDVSATFSPGFANPYTDVAGRAGGSEANPFPFSPPSGSTAAATLWSNFFPLSLNVFNPNYTTPEAMNYNLTIQRELAGNTIFSVGYVGALGRHLIRPIEGNPITLAGQQACLADVDPVTGCSPATGNGNFLFQHQLYPTHSVYPGNIFGSVGTQSTDGNSTYNALQVSINKGFSHGLGMLANFTWSHAIDDGSGFEDSGFQVRAVNPYPQFAFLNKGDSSYDARRRFVSGFTYQAPGLHGHDALNMLVGGWQLSGIVTLQSGFPVNISDSGFTSATCDVFEYFDCWDSPLQIAPLKTGDPRTNAFGTAPNVVSHVLFNGPATFAPAVPTLGGPALFGVARNSFHGPGLNNWDMALEKRIYLHPGHESQYLQLRLEAYNLFNHTQFCNTAGPYPCINNDVESGSFGQVKTVNPSRLVQLGAKFYF